MRTHTHTHTHTHTLGSGNGFGKANCMKPLLVGRGGVGWKGVRKEDKANVAPDYTTPQVQTTAAYLPPLRQGAGIGIITHSGKTRDSRCSRTD
jgi:hypothetical protein